MQSNVANISIIKPIQRHFHLQLRVYQGLATELQLLVEVVHLKTQARKLLSLESFA